MDNFKVIYRILRYLEKAMDCDFPNMDSISPGALGITQQRWTALMAMLVHEKYIYGLAAKYFCDGAVIISGTFPRITLRGLEYLQESPLMKKYQEFGGHKK